MRIDEVYLSVQGEGPRVGIPTVFTRFGGCNLRCPGWPCDTQHAIDVKYRDEWIRMDPGAIFHRISDVIGDREGVSVCLTGGEPFLQRDQDLYDLVTHIRLKGWLIECFSNGTIPYPTWATDQINFIMDWKLPGSGEDPLNGQRIKNLQNLKEKDAIKFVIKDREDFELAKQVWNDNVRHTPVQVFYGIVWDAMTNATLVKWVLDDQLPWRLNIQSHNHIWDRRKRGI